MAPDMRRRALLASATAVSTASLAGCPTPPWSDDPTEIDGADVTFRREYDGEIDGVESGGNDVAEVRRRLDEDPPRLVVAGSLLDGPRRCERVTMSEAAIDDGTLRLRIVSEDDPDWDGGVCPDVAEFHPYSVAVGFAEASVPERVVVRHEDETVLEESV
jgi:hypothetical protein